VAIARTTLAFIGTDESTGDTITNNSTDTGSEVDVLGDNTSVGEVELYLVFTSTVTAGSLDVTVNKRRVTGQAYAKLVADFAIAPISGTQKVPLGRFAASRYMNVTVKNNATGASATNVFVGGELYKVS
jgi:hypothetical protein